MLTDNDEEKITAYLELSGFNSDPDGITELLSIRPEAIARKGDIKRRDPSGKRPSVLYEKNFWHVRSRLTGARRADEHVADLLDMLQPKKSVFSELSKECDAHIEVTGEVGHPHIVIFLETEQIAELSQLNIAMGVSIYSMLPNYLQSAEQRSELQAFLESLSAIKRLSTKVHDEAESIVNALKAIEDNATSVQNSLVRQLLWSDVPEEDRLETLEAIKLKMNVIQTAINDSKLFTAKATEK